MRETTELTTDDVVLLKELVAKRGVCNYTDGCENCPIYCENGPCWSNSAFARASSLLTKYEEYVDSILLENEC